MGREHSVHQKVLWLPWDSFRTSESGDANRYWCEMAVNMQTFSQIWGKNNVGKQGYAELGHGSWRKRLCAM